MTDYEVNNIVKKINHVASQQHRIIHDQKVVLKFTRACALSLRRNKKIHPRSSALLYLVEQHDYKIPLGYREKGLAGLPFSVVFLTQLKERNGSWEDVVFQEMLELATEIKSQKKNINCVSMQAPPQFTQ